MPHTWKRRMPDDPTAGGDTNAVPFAELWERHGLSKRDRSLITVATLIALQRTGELALHLQRALDDGVNQDELIELFTHLAFYAGWPAARMAVAIARRIV